MLVFNDPPAMHAGSKHAAKKVTMGLWPLFGSRVQGCRRSHLISRLAFNNQHHRRALIGHCHG